MFEKHFNRKYEMDDFPYFVPKQEREYNLDFAKRMVEERWVYYRWREDIERGGYKRNQEVAKKIVAHGGLILEICAGPGGGFSPAILMQNYDAHLMISDLCPTVVKEWYKLFHSMDNAPSNVEYAALDVCDLPFYDNCLDVVSGSGAIINIEGDRDKALKEIYRVLKPGGLFVFDYIYVTQENYNKMPQEAREIIKKRYPTIFWDCLEIFEHLGFSKVETIQTNEWSNKDDESSLANLCRELNTELIFSCFIKYCIK